MCRKGLPGTEQRTEPPESELKTPPTEMFPASFRVRCNMHPAEMNSSVMERSMWCPLPPQLQSVQALLPTQGVLGAHFVGRLCGGDVDLGVLGGALSCRETKTGFF